VARILTLHDPAEARAYYDAGLWRADTLYSLAARWAVYCARGGVAPRKTSARKMTTMRPRV